METGGEWRMRVRDRGGDRWGVENESERYGWRQVGSGE